MGHTLISTYAPFDQFFDLFSPVPTSTHLDDPFVWLRNSINLIPIIDMKEGKIEFILALAPKSLN